jgi:hypothetical protein
MANRSRVRLATDVTLERERESFSNRAAIRKILPENNVLTACSACSFWRTGAKIRLAGIEAEGWNRSGIAGKHPNKVSQSP